MYLQWWLVQDEGGGGSDDTGLWNFAFVRTLFVWRWNKIIRVPIKIRLLIFFYRASPGENRERERERERDGSTQIVLSVFDACCCSFVDLISHWCFCWTQSEGHTYLWPIDAAKTRTDTSSRWRMWLLFDHFMECKKYCDTLVSSLARLAYLPTLEIVDCVFHPGLFHNLTC